ncbi:MAG: sugar phosphate isomerase/epimerase family protein [Geminicoccaceae bacterium]
MKIGFNMLLWTTHVTDEHFRLLGELKKTGYDGIEIPVFEGDPSHFRELGARCRDEGLGATAVTVMPGPDKDACSADAGCREGALNHLKWAIDCTQAAGAELLGGPIHQALGHFTGEPRTADQWRWAVETLGRAADYAGEANIDLSVEPLNRFECYFLNTVEDAASFVGEVNKDNVGLLYDTFHANIEEKHPVGALRKAIARINHVHISANDRGTPGKDHLPWSETFSVLKENGYDRWLTIEAFGRALPDLAAATRVWRDFFPNQEEVYQFGYRFIRNGWDAS